MSYTCESWAVFSSRMPSFAAHTRISSALGPKAPTQQQAIMMMIIITRYPASEDRLIVRPLLNRVCALRLQPAEPQPYNPPPDS